MSAPRFTPLGLDLSGLPCVVVGGGAVGARKATTLAAAGARVTVVSPRVSDGVAHAVATEDVRWVAECFREAHLEDAFLVVTATDDEVVNARVAEAAFRRRVLLCDATAAGRTRVIFGATLDLGDATVAVFTDGRDPGRARATRDLLATLVGSAPPVREDAAPEEAPAPAGIAAAAGSPGGGRP